MTEKSVIYRIHRRRNPPSRRVDDRMFGVYDDGARPDFMGSIQDKKSRQKMSARLLVIYHDMQEM